MNPDRGAITQLVECHNGIVKVSGSSPLSSIVHVLLCTLGEKMFS